jgi:hypothetical protein
MKTIMTAYRPVAAIETFKQTGWGHLRNVKLRTNVRSYSGSRGFLSLANDASLRRATSIGYVLSEFKSRWLRGTQLSQIAIYGGGSSAGAECKVSA